MNNNKLDLDFYLQPTETVARELIGKIFVKIEAGKVLSGRIVETEAYLSAGDLSSHSAVGKTQRNAAMFEMGGILYVYMIYGKHHCINIVTEDTNIGAAVLIRAMEPLEGIETFFERRGTNIKTEKLLSGPGNLAKAFNFKRTDSYLSLLSDYCYILDNPKINEIEIEITKRIGITKSKELFLRFVDKNSNSLSK